MYTRTHLRIYNRHTMEWDDGARWHVRGGGEERIEV